jgi:hypothetical protein
MLHSQDDGIAQGGGGFRADNDLSSDDARHENGYSWKVPPAALFSAKSLHLCKGGTSMASHKFLYRLGHNGLIMDFLF